MTDFETVLNKALANLAELRDKAMEVLNGYNAFANPEYDAAYQIWQDLNKAHEELSRTKAMIDNGYI